MQNIVRDLLVLANLEGDNKPPSDDARHARGAASSARTTRENLSSGRHRITFDTDEALTVTGVGNGDSSARSAIS